MREWAKSQGMDVSERGRISADVQQAYDAAH
ncbi:MAG TPA: histone-like nucleoid-structuring protein Lsr2 [Nocardioides sp.]|nr:histone-like nucleoid-structuring protein Lsr2 [Nocardioides sp.]